MIVIAGWALNQQRRAMLPGVVLVIGAATTAAGLAVLIPQHGHATLTGVNVTWNCAGTAPELCLHPALDGARPAVTAVVTPVARRLAGTPFAIHRAEQRPRGMGSAPSPGAVAFALDDTTPGAVRLAGHELAVNALGDQATCYTDTGPARGYDLAQLVGAWVAGDRALYISDSPTNTSARRWFDNLNDTRRRAWLTSHQRAIRACELDAAAFR